MHTDDARRLWRVSARLSEKTGLAGMARRGRFMLEAWRHRRAMEPLLHAAPERLLGRMLRQRPEFLELAVAPYFAADWDTPTRIGQFVENVETLEAHAPDFAFDIHQSVELMDLAPVGPSYHVVIDKPEWFHREGQLTLNLFRDNVRLFCLSFALSRANGKLVARIGGIQGRNLPGILDEYRDITKAAHGLRPRDLVIDLFRMFCEAIGVVELLAVSDECRHHRSPYFGFETDREMPLDYDAIWKDRGGVWVDRFFYRLPLGRQIRDEADIPAKKRGMYRKRYAMLEELEHAMANAVRNVKPVVRPEAE